MISVVPQLVITGPWAIVLTIALFYFLGNFAVLVGKSIRRRTRKNRPSLMTGTAARPRPAFKGQPTSFSTTSGSWDLRMLPFAPDDEVRSVFRNMPIRSAVAILSSLDSADREELLARLHLAGMVRKAIERSAIAKNAAFAILH